MMVAFLQMSLGFFLVFLVLSYAFSPTGVAILGSVFVGWLGWLTYKRIREG